MRAPRLLRRPALLAASALLLAVLLAGCAAADESAEPAADPSAATPGSSRASSPGTASPSSPGAGGAVAARPAPGEPPAALSEDVPEIGTEADASLAEVVDAAVADLAGRLGVDPGSVDVLAARPVTWPDAALGCPEEGTAYAQVLTDGAAIELEVDGARYRYHTGAQTGEVVACNVPSGPSGDA